MREYWLSLARVPSARLEARVGELRNICRISTSSHGLGAPAAPGGGAGAIHLMPAGLIGTLMVAPVKGYTARAASVSGGVGIVSVWPGITLMRMSASRACMVSCGYSSEILPPAKPLG